MSLLTTSPQEVVGAVGAVASATTQVAGAGTQAVLNVTGINAFLGYFDPNYLENEKTRHLTSLKSNSNFRLTSFLIKELLDTLERVEYNKKCAQLLRRQVLLVLDRLGNLSYGLITKVPSVLPTRIARTEAEVDANTDATDRKLSKIDGVLSRTLRYMTLLTSEDALSYFLDGDAKTRFEKYHQALADETNALLSFYRIRDGYRIPPYDLTKREINGAYIVACDLRHSPSSARLFALIDKVGGSNDESNVIAVRQAIQRVTSTLESLSSHADSLTHLSAIHLIKQPVMREFWFSTFPHRYEVSVEEFGGGLMAKLKLPDEEENEIAELALVDLVQRVKSILSKKKAGFVDVIEAAKAVRHIPSSKEINLTAVLEAIATHDGSVRNIPPPPVIKRVAWNDIQSSELRLLLSTRGWVSVVGPQSSGKTTRLLDVVHSLPKERDALWVNLSGVTNVSDVWHRVASQLYLRDCTTEAAFSIQFRATLDSLKDNAVIVFDNVPMKGEDGTPLNHTEYFNLILRISQEFKHKCCFACVSQKEITIGGQFYDPNIQNALGHFVSEDVFSRSMTFQQLQVDTAMEWAEVLFKFDADMLMGQEVLPVADKLAKAADQETGQIAMLAQFGDLRCIQSKSIKQDHVDGSKLSLQESRGLVVLECIREFSKDELLCAACLKGDVAPFDPSLGWALCKKKFQGDMVRWLIAWRGLVRRGWLVYESDVGFFIPGYTSMQKTLEDALIIYLEESKADVPTWLPSSPTRTATAGSDLSELDAAGAEDSAEQEFDNHVMRLRDCIAMGQDFSYPAKGAEFEGERLEIDGAILREVSADVNHLEIYLKHWAEEAARVNNDSARTTAALLYYDAYFPHFRHLFDDLVAGLAGRSARSASTSTKERGLINMVDTARTLAGNLSRLLNARYRPEEGVEIAEAVRDLLDPRNKQGGVSGGDKALHLRAVADWAVQMARYEVPLNYRSRFVIPPITDLNHQKRLEAAGAYLSPLLRPIETDTHRPDGSWLEINISAAKLVGSARVLGYSVPDLARGYAALAYVRHCQTRFPEAVLYYERALDLWQQDNLVHDNAADQHETANCSLFAKQGLVLGVIGLGIAGALERDAVLPPIAPGQCACAPVTGCAPSADCECAPIPGCEPCVPGQGCGLEQKGCAPGCTVM